MFEVYISWMLDEQINVVIFPASYSDDLIILVVVSIYYVYVPICMKKINIWQPILYLVIFRRQCDQEYILK